jgi:hypothetical protein
MQRAQLFVLCELQHTDYPDFPADNEARARAVVLDFEHI